MKKELLIEFIDWLREHEDVYYAFDNTEEVVEEFLELNK
jgi:predicted P-loop ATPase